MQVRTRNGLRLTGFYRGQVIQHLDGGRCKVFVPGVYPDRYADSPDDLPPAEQAAPLFGGTCLGNGTFSYPNIGTVVWLFFENEDQNRPVYFAATLGGELAVETEGSGFKAVRDNVCPDIAPELDTTRNGQDSQQHMVNCGDTRVVLRESGQLDILCSDALGGTSSHVFVDSDGSVQIRTSQSIQIDTPSLKVTAHDKLEVNTTSLVVRANNEIQVNSPQVATVAANTFSVKSPSIEMDATQGKFVAKGANHAPMFLT